MEIGENPFEIQRYAYIISVCQEIELGENSTCLETRLFLPRDSLVPGQIEKPYTEIEAYEYISEHLREVKRGKGEHLCPHNHL